MEDSLRVRIDKVFGCLSTPSWTLSDEEKQGTYRSSETQTCEDDEFRSSVGLDAAAAEETDLVREVRSSIGLDCTLDFEEEEDEFDRVALGQQDSCERMYMMRVKETDVDFGYGIDVDAHTELPDSFDQVCRDPRANHSAARLRLREDAHVKPVVKPILKESRVGDKSSKRVRFNLDHSPCVDEEAVQVYTKKSDDPALPDYLRNPTRYTRYTLDDSPDDMDEASNHKAYMDLFNLLNKNKNKKDEVEEASQHQLTFTPRNKCSSSSAKEDEVKPFQSKFVSVPATVDQDCIMDDIEMEMETERSHKPGRHYRMRTVVDEDTAT